MVSLRLTRLDEVEADLDRLRQRREGMFQTGRLVGVDMVTGACTVEIFGRLGATARIGGGGSLVDDPQNLIGLTCKLLVESGEISRGAWILGPAGLVAPVADMHILPHGGTLQARDRRAFPDVKAWQGQAFVGAGSAVVVNSVRLVVESVTDGTGVMVFSDGSNRVVFREASRDRDSQPNTIMVLRPTIEPFRVYAESAPATFTMSLEVDRTANGLLDFDDAVLEVPYVTGSQPASQRLAIETTSGAGLPNMSIYGRTG